jgi:hypothetical protein
MKLFILWVAVFLAVPTMHAQQGDADQKSAPAAATQSTGASDRQASNNQPRESQDIKPGHPLDPADVEILTGKRDREIEASRRNNSILMDNYGDYASPYGRNGFEFNQRRIGILDMDLPFRRIGDSFFFFNGTPGGFGSRGFGGRGGRTPRARH